MAYPEQAMQAEDLAALKRGDVFYVVDEDTGGVLKAVIGGNNPDTVVLFNYAQFPVGSFSLSSAINRRRIFERDEQSPYYRTREDAVRALD